MAQAALDLPDPLEQPAPANVASADDLLAQLAGDEIDRLLAEADVHRDAETVPEANGAEDAADAPAPNAAPPASSPPVTDVAQATAATGASASAAESATRNEARGAKQSPPPPVGADSVNAVAPNESKVLDTGPLKGGERTERSIPAAQATTAFEGPLANELDDLFQQLDGYSAELNSKAAAPAAEAAPRQGSPPSSIVKPDVMPVTPLTPTLVQTRKPELAASEPTPAPQAVASETKEAAPAAAAPIPAAPETQTTVAERDALNVGGQAAPAASAALLAADDEPTETQDVPFYLRPLVWLSAPLASAPRRVTDLVGQLAIMTLLNAIAILIYVMVFRKH